MTGDADHGGLGLNMRRSFAVGLVLALMTLVCFHPLTRHPGDLLVGPQRGGQNDLTSAFMAYRGYQQVALGEYGQLPTLGRTLSGRRLPSQA